MNKFGKWEKDRPDFIKYISLMLASSSERLYDIFKDYNKFLMNLGIINISEIDVWLEYYRNESKLYEKLKELLIKSVENGNILISLAIIQLKEIFSNLISHLKLFWMALKFFRLMIRCFC